MRGAGRQGDVVVRGGGVRTRAAVGAVRVGGPRAVRVAPLRMRVAAAQHGQVVVSTCHAAAAGSRGPALPALPARRRASQTCGAPLARPGPRPRHRPQLHLFRLRAARAPQAAAAAAASADATAARAAARPRAAADRPLAVRLERRARALERRGAEAHGACALGGRRRVHALRREARAGRRGGAVLLRRVLLRVCVRMRQARRLRADPAAARRAPDQARAAAGHRADRAGGRRAGERGVQVRQAPPLRAGAAAGGRPVRRRPHGGLHVVASEPEAARRCLRRRRLPCCALALGVLPLQRCLGRRARRLCALPVLWLPVLLLLLVVVVMKMLILLLLLLLLLLLHAAMRQPLADPRQPPGRRRARVRPLPAVLVLVQRVLRAAAAPQPARQPLHHLGQHGRYAQQRAALARRGTRQLLRRERLRGLAEPGVRQRLLRGQAAVRVKRHEAAQQVEAGGGGLGEKKGVGRRWRFGCGGRLVRRSRGDRHTCVRVNGSAWAAAACVGFPPTHLREDALQRHPGRGLKVQAVRQVRHAGPLLGRRHAQHLMGRGGRRVSGVPRRVSGRGAAVGEWESPQIVPPHSRQHPPSQNSP